MIVFFQRTPIAFESPSFRQGLPESKLQGCATMHRFTKSHHTRQDAGIQCQGWQTSNHPLLLDSGNPCRNDGLRVSYN